MLTDSDRELQRIMVNQEVREGIREFIRDFVGEFEKQFELEMIAAFKRMREVVKLAGESDGEG